MVKFIHNNFTSDELYLSSVDLIRIFFGKKIKVCGMIIEKKKLHVQGGSDNENRN